MKNLLLILTAITLFGCSKSNDMNGEKIKQTYNFAVGVEFSVFNSQNEDLLNPENPDHWDTSKIKLFYLINGKKQEVYDPSLDNPRNFMIYKHEKEYRIRVTPNYLDTTDKQITYIQWNETDTDTIEATFTKTQNAVVQNIVWLNGEQVWELGDNTVDPYFILIK